MRRLRLFYIPFLMLLVLFGLGIGTVEATDGMRGNRCVVKSEDYIEHDFYFTCQTLTVNGIIDGDLIGIASEVTIRGTVTGDIWVMGGQLTIQGIVGDDVHFTGLDLDITEDAQFPDPRIDITAASMSVEIASGASIPGDLLMIGYQGLIFGDIGGNIDFQGQTLNISGKVGGSVDAIVGDSREEVNVRSIPFIPYSIDLRDYGLYFSEQAQIAGDLRYEAAQQANLPRGVVQGTTTYKQVIAKADITRAERPRTFLSILSNYMLTVVKDVVALMLVGMLALQFAPVIIVEPSIRVKRSFLPAVSWGLILFVLFFPIALSALLISILLVIIITVITLATLTFMVAILLTILNLTFAFGFWFSLVFLGRTITCFLIGHTLFQSARYYLARRHHDPDDPPIYIPPISPRYRWIPLALGAVIYSLVVNMPLPSPVPTLELIFEAVVALSGLGAIFMMARDAWYTYESRRTGTIIRQRPNLDLDLLEEGDVPLGAENLPEGFQGFLE